MKRDDLNGAADYKKLVTDWIKTHPAHSKVIIVAVLVVVFCIIFVSCKGKSEDKAKKTKQSSTTVVTPQTLPQQEVVAPVPTVDSVPEIPTEELGANIDISLPGNVKIELVKINKGSFLMGSPDSEKGRDRKSEKVRKAVIAEDYYIGVYEVTQAQYNAVMGQNPSTFKGKSLPVENVTLANASMFCDKLNAEGYAPEGWKFALPSGAQWEYACRAGSKTAFAWGNALNGDKANCYGSKPYGTTKKGKYLRKTVEVGSYQPNAWGIYDMHGNVLEWCSTNKKIKNVSYYEIRGGSWAQPAGNSRSAATYLQKASSKNSLTGFRVVLVK